MKDDDSVQLRMDDIYDHALSAPYSTIFLTVTRRNCRYYTLSLSTLSHPINPPVTKQELSKAPSTSVLFDDLDKFTTR
jgi:hypothetical protein